MKTIEQLAEIHHSATFKQIHKQGGDFSPWESISDQRRQVHYHAMRAALSALYASIEGVPSETQVENVWANTPGTGANCARAVRNLMLAAFAKQAQALQSESDEYFTKLEEGKSV